MLEHMTVIIPAYNPGRNLLDVITGLQQKGLKDILIVNDGSDASCDHIFAKIQDCTVLVHENNQGKGSALKTAFSYCVTQKKETEFILTVDADGQHLPEDVLACAKALLEHPDALVLGSRTFQRESTPARSYLGNQLTKKVFSCFCGIRVEDTQTGLRGFSVNILSDLLAIPGNRYEYETQMLVELHRKQIPLIQVPVSTVYLEDNQTSHFRPVVDSCRIYRIIFLAWFSNWRKLKKLASFTLASLTSTGIDLALFTVFGIGLRKCGMSVTASIYTATIAARICSSLYNYAVNKKLVFRNGNTSSLWKYYLLCSCQMLVSASLVNGITLLLHSNGLFQTAIKSVVDTALFFASFFIQKNWVFRPAKKI